MTEHEEFAKSVSRMVAEHLLDVAACNAWNAGMTADEIRDVVMNAISDGPDIREQGGLSVIMPKCCLPDDDDDATDNGVAA